MTRYLLDTNLLIPLLWPRHTERALVVRWFAENGRGCFATSSFTQTGFLRLASSAQVMKEPYSVLEARELLRRLTLEPGHAFWPTTIDVFEATKNFEMRLHGPKQVTDAYLLGLAIHYGGKLATMDKRIVHLAGPECAEHVELIG